MLRLAGAMKLGRGSVKHKSAVLTASFRRTGTYIVPSNYRCPCLPQDKLCLDSWKGTGHISRDISFILMRTASRSPRPRLQQRPFSTAWSRRSSPCTSQAPSFPGRSLSELNRSENSRRPITAVGPARQMTARQVGPQTLGRYCDALAKPHTISGPVQQRERRGRTPEVVHLATCRRADTPRPEDAAPYYSSPSCVIL